VLIAVLPTLASVIPIPTAFHVAALIFAVPTTLFALVIGWRRHRHPFPLIAGVVGLALLMIAVSSTNARRARRR
jgi:multisubunit Na+/H+ antiporter MnhB subunit